MRTLFTGDWQTALSNLDRCELTLQHILEIIRTENCGYVIHCGDVKEHLNPIDVRAANFLVRATQEILRAGAKFFVIRGNHDSITTQDGVPSILPIMKGAGATVIDSQSTQGRIFNEHYNVWLHFVPYFRDADAQRAAFKESYLYRQPGLRILVFHNEIAGCEMSAFKKGSTYSPADLYAKDYDICIGGHIHKQQFLKPNIWYVGSPFCCDWSECNQTKGFLLLDVPEKIQKGEQRRKISITTIPSRIPGWFDPGVPGYKPPADWKGAHVRHTVTVYKDPVKEMHEAQKLLEKKFPGAVLHLQPDFQKNVPINENIDIKGTDENILRNYLSKQAIPENATIEQAITFLKEFLPHLGLFGVQGIKFKSVTAKNVLCFEDVTLDLTRKGTTLITGINQDWADRENSNGAGKSSLVSLPFIPLFGKTFKLQKSDEWARNSTKLSAGCDLLAELPNGHKFKVHRQRRKGVLRVFEDGNEITMGSPDATQALIESKTNLTWDVLTNAVYVGQREIGSVFGTEKERKELFSRLLGLDRFLEAQEKIRKIINRVKTALEETESEISSTNRAIQEADSGRGEIEAALKETPAVDPKSVVSCSNEIAKLEFTIRDNSKKAADFEPTLTANQKEFEDYLFKAGDAEAEERELQKQINAANGVSSAAQCPTCGSLIEIESIEAHVRGLTQRKQKAGGQADHYEALQLKNRTLRATLIKQIQDWNLESKKLQVKVDALHKEASQIQEQIQARARLEALLNRKDSRVKELNRILRIHSQARDGYVDEIRFLEFCANTVGRNGLPSYLCTIVAPHLNRAAITYSQVFAKSVIGVQFAIANGDIDIEIYNLHGGSTLKDQSNGETRLTALIAAFALREVLVPMGLLILDEPTEGMDAVNAQAFAKGLNQVAEKFGTVLVISHNAHFLAALEPDYHIQITKKGGIATVKEI